MWVCLTSVYLVLNGMLSMGEGWKQIVLVLTDNKATLCFPAFRSISRSVSAEASGIAWRASR